ncbi:hypothetical protein AK812_SmicGene39339 [Symbiodinium microadriaticum]|uniref:Uncharacterized protein n=1 Tax=Symbiodinium microadriaticum TaxID=2951 RepID=A0A1Q9CBG5_SYMMI|nr:hypothetical protein AK812_SmicGene39339 [Symbiodinium microadriaticum]CAE7444605.1 unnamed protein product [Symbiodinium microadriaticum]CAE7638289.1 unnamed protein product [Symbiodinium sp. KB8]
MEAIENSEEWNFYQASRPAGFQVASGPPSEVSTAATAEEHEAQAAKTENKGGRGKGSQGTPGSSGDGAGQSNKRQGQWGGGGGGRKEWPGNWKDSGSSGDGAELQEMQKLMTMMQKLVLRHEDSINLLKLEYSFVAHMKQNALDANPGDVDKLAELAELGWVVKGPPLTWHFLKWDPVPPDASLRDTMQGESIVFLIQVGNFGDASLSIRTSLKSLCYNAALQLVATQLKADRVSRSTLANNIAASIKGEANLHQSAALPRCQQWSTVKNSAPALNLKASCFVRDGYEVGLLSAAEHPSQLSWKCRGRHCSVVLSCMPPLRKKQRYSLSSTDRHCDGSDYAVVDDVDCDSESEEVVCQGVSTASGSEPGGSVPLVVGGVFMVGAQPPTSYELDLRYEYARQHVYLLRNVRVGDLQVRWPQENPAPQTAADTCAPADSKRFTVGAWNFGNMAGVVNNTVAYPWVTRALAGILGTWSEELQFTSCTLSLNTQAALHRDSRNLANSVNLALPCSEFQGGQLFIEVLSYMVGLGLIEMWLCIVACFGSGFSEEAMDS